jgi:hypothetical protein
MINTGKCPKVGTIFEFGNAQKAIVVKVLNQEEGHYYCVYHQNERKYVVQEFTYSDSKWIMSNESGRAIRPPEWSSLVSELENNV